MKTKLRPTALILVGLLTVTAALARIAVGNCLPGTDEVRGWKVIANTYKECTEPEGLQELYNGGWEKWRDAGVVRAATQSYKKDKQIVVYIHDFSGPGQATAWYNQQVAQASKRAGGSKSVQIPNGKAAYSSAGPVTTGNLVRGRVHAIVNAQGSSAEAQSATAAFLQVIGRKIGENY